MHIHDYKLPLRSMREYIHSGAQRLANVMGYLMMALLFPLTTCTRHGDYDALLRTADSLVNVRPDSVIQLLEPLGKEQEDMAAAQRMRWLLLLTSAQNKCDTIFHSDSLQLELVRYYDRHGSPNERMTAHYLLGRAYSDMGEAPRALQCFLDAVACADTTSRGCDFQNLFRIYGQIAMIYQTQYIPTEELGAWERFSHFAMRSGDIYNYIRGKEMSLLSYYDMGDTVACLRITEECRKEYERHGMHQAAASVFPMAIYIHLLKSDYAHAKEMMDIFENDSGLFDSCGNISKGREGYYYSKGLYYMGVQENDSAELFLRKLQSFHYNHDFQANKGLLSLYQGRGNTDSVAKYALLYEKSADAIISENQADAVAQAAAYNKYSRLQEESEKLAVRAENSKWMSRVSLMMVLFIVSVSAYFFVRYKKMQKKKIEALGVSYTNLMSEYRQACHEAESLRLDRDLALREKADEAAKLKSRLDEMRVFYEQLSPVMKKMVMSKSDIVKKFKEMAVPNISKDFPDSRDWTLLKETMEYSNPALYERIFVSDNLSQQEIYVCLLTILHFSSSEIAVLLDTSKQRVSNLKASANYKLFGEKSAVSFLDNLDNIQSAEGQTLT